MKKFPKRQMQLSKGLNVNKNINYKPDFNTSDYWEYCVNCGNKLLIRKCKLICSHCGFFHSCSEP